jgi:hypothetical protein
MFMSWAGFVGVEAYVSVHRLDVTFWHFEFLDQISQRNWYCRTVLGWRLTHLNSADIDISCYRTSSRCGSLIYVPTKISKSILLGCRFWCTYFFAVYDVGFDSRKRFSWPHYHHLEFGQIKTVLVITDLQSYDVQGVAITFGVRVFLEVHNNRISSTVRNRSRSLLPWRYYDRQV